jgi:hypothetical protein|tara:strand:- start:1044 stop:1322 length:279 start_codon:yes stop_codon:yes gene_type:complete
VNKIALMDYSIDITDLCYDSAGFETRANQYYCLSLDYTDNTWHLFDGINTAWAEDALLSGNINQRTCIYKLLPKVLRFIHDRDHTKREGREV